MNENHVAYNFIRKQGFFNFLVKYTLTKIKFLKINILKITKSLELNYFEVKINNVIQSLSPPEQVSKFFGKNLYYAIVGRTSKISLLSNQGEVLIKFNNYEKHNIIFFSIAFSEKKLILNRSLLKFSEFLLDVKLYDDKNTPHEIQKFTIPVNKGKHGTHYHEIGKNWLDFSLNIPPKFTKNLSLNISVSLSKSKTLALSNPTKKKEDFNNKKTEFFISEPKLFSLGKSVRKKDLIFYLSIESFTDPQLFMNKNRINELMPTYSALCKDAIVYTKAYSSGDSTLPAMGTFSSGLRVGQHCFGDYSQDPTQHQIDFSLQTVPVAFKKLGFHTVGFTTFPRLSHRYRWHVGFDHYFNSDKPFHDDAVNIDTITRYLDNSLENKMFLFAHLTRLHLPLFSNDDRQSPFYVNINALSESYKYKNYENLYISAYQALDNELSKFVSYLKHKGIYDMSTIIVVGDHGIKMPPLWKNQVVNGFDLYEQHVRVPFIFKPSEFSKARHEVKDISCPINSHFGALKHLKYDYSQLMFEDVIQKEIDEKVCISETIYHPQRNNYSICLIDKKFKYWSMYDFDWEKYKPLNLVSEALFKAKGISFDEKSDLSFKLSKETKVRQNYISSYIEKNKNLRNSYNNRPPI